MNNLNRTRLYPLVHYCKIELLQKNTTLFKFTLTKNFEKCEHHRHTNQGER